MANEKYSIESDFSSGIDQKQFHGEVSADGTIGSLFVGTKSLGDICTCLLTTELNGSQKTVLDGLVAAHVPVSNPVDEDEGQGDLNSHVHYKQAKDESTSNKTEWKQKIVMTTEELVGKVRLSWCYQWKYSVTNSKICVRVTVDGNEIWKHEQEPKDTSDWHPVDSKMYETLAEGVHVIVLEYMPSQNGKTARLKNALIELKEFRED